MKTILALCFLSLSSFLSFSMDKPSFPVTGEKVVINEWGSRGIYILDNFFKETQKVIIKKIGAEEFEMVKNNCSEAAWPSSMTTGFEATEEEEAAFYAKMNELNIYRICTYQHKFNGNTFEIKAIIRIPYDENVEWQAGVVWEGNIYFIINDSAVEAK